MRRKPLVVPGVLSLGLAFLATACSDQAVPEGERTDLPSLSETATSPGAWDDVAFAGSALAQALDGRSEHASVGLDDTGAGLVLYWHGEPPASELAALASTYPDVSVEVRTTDYLPGDLRVLASELLSTEQSAGVGMVAVRNDGSGLDVGVHPDRTSETLDEIATRLTASTGVPVAVTPDAPVPAM